jgi:ribosomal 30S subunit maturation factor RimM
MDKQHNVTTDIDERRKEQQMTKQHIVTTDIDKVIRGNMAVRDANGQKIGVVRNYSNEAGYLVVLTGRIARKELYIPYSAIQSIDPRELFLSIEKAKLTGDYSAPPHATIVVDGDTASTELASGYDASTVEFNRVNLAQVRKDLVPGMKVSATGGVDLGTVEGIDRQAGYMVVKEHFPGKKRFFIPFPAILSVDRQHSAVMLTVSKDILLKDHAELPENIVLRVDAFQLTGVDVAVKDVDAAVNDADVTAKDHTTA